MTRFRSSAIVASLLVVFALSFPSFIHAEYTKLYRFKNRTGQSMGGVRAINNALEVVTETFALPDTWDVPGSSPVVTPMLVSGTYSTGLTWTGPEVPNLTRCRAAWSTADNSCRLRELRWVLPDGTLGAAITDAVQYQGVPGGGQVHYDYDEDQYVWTITNDTGADISLADCALSVLDHKPTLEELNLLLWPGDTAMSKGGNAELPHPDLVAMRVEAIIEDQLVPLIAAVEAERGQPYLPAQDIEPLLALLRSAVSHLESGRDQYDPYSPGAAQEHWDAAQADLATFVDLVRECAGRTDRDQSAAYRLGPYLSRPRSSTPVTGTTSLNDAGALASADYHDSSNWTGYVWDTKQWNPQDPLAGFQSLHQEDPARDFVGDIDAQGRVAGAIMRPGDMYTPCVWEPDPATGQYVRRDLQTSGWDYGYVYGMNDVGQAVGWGFTAGGWQALLLDLTTGMHPIGSQVSAGADINNHGQIVSYTNLVVHDTNGAVVTSLEDPGWADFRLTGINDRGETCGVKFDHPRKAGAWDSDGNFIDLHSPGWESSWAWDINNLGQVVGDAKVNGVWRAKMWDINTSPPTFVDLHVSWATSSRGDSINNRGEVAEYMNVNGWPYTTLWLPDPPPLPQALADDWTYAADVALNGIAILPGPPAEFAELLEAPAEPPVAPPPLQGDPPMTYVVWDEIQEDDEAVLPAGTYSAFVVDDHDTTPDEALLLVTKYEDPAAPGDYIIESAEMYVAENAQQPPVGDTTPPVIAAASASPETLWPPNHKMREITLDVSVDDDNPGATWYIESVSSNQSENGKGDGNTESDWLLDPDSDPQALSLRAERSGKKKEPRTYTVVLRAVDAAGHVSDAASVEVRVEHDKGNGSKIGSLTAVPTRGGMVEIAFTLFGDAAVEADIMNLAGRPIKRIVTDRACETGTNSLVWNCRSDRGTLVPSGTYLVRVTARSEDGEQTSGLCAVRVAHR